MGSRMRRQLHTTSVRCDRPAVAPPRCFAFGWCTEKLRSGRGPVSTKKEPDLCSAGIHFIVRNQTGRRFHGFGVARQQRFEQGRKNIGFRTAEGGGEIETTRFCRELVDQGLRTWRS